MSEKNKDQSSSAPEVEGNSAAVKLNSGDVVPGADRLLRWVDPVNHVKLAAVPPRISSAHFCAASRDGGVSADIESLICAAGLIIEAHTDEQIKNKPGFGAVMWKVNEIRERGCEIHYAPIKEDVEKNIAANPFHANISGKLNQTNRSKLAKELTVEWVKKVKGIP